MRTTRANRALLGLVAAAFSTFVALLSHIAAGGEMPGSWGILTPLVLSVVICVALSGRRLALWRLSVAVSLSQLLFHSLFVLGAPTAASGLAAHAGHGIQGAQTTLGLLPAGGTAPSVAMHGMLHADAWMWCAHGLAALVTVAALHRGEVMLGAIAAAATLVIRRLIPLVAQPPAPAELRSPRAAAQPSFARALRPLGYFPSTVARRGPPAAACL